MMVVVGRSQRIFAASSVGIALLACSASGSSDDDLGLSNVSGSGPADSSIKGGPDGIAPGGDGGRALDAGHQDVAPGSIVPDAEHDAHKDTGAAPDGSTNEDVCPLDAQHIAEAFLELTSSNPKLCTSNPCPNGRCCVPVYMVCVPN